ncbi:amidohydrolase family protein [Filifactor villosus]|uniref:Amidohydrolase family protein n=1 Tax=Filifactor villosus TaxID=29374 RepID=A0ABV9QJJ7_9FIRM
MRLYSNYIVLKDSVAEGTIEIEGEHIKEVRIGDRPEGEFLDCTGKFVMPGMINIQSRNFDLGEAERYFSQYPMLRQFNRVDRASALSGITTVYHSIDIEEFLRGYDGEQAVERLNKLRIYKEEKHLVEHKIHLKFRIGDIRNIEFMKHLISNGLVDLITYMGSVRGEQEYFKDEYFLEYLKEKFDIKDRLAWAILERIKERRFEINQEEIAYRFKYAASARIPVATTKYRLSESMEKKYSSKISIILDPVEPEALDYVQKNHKYATIDASNLWDLDKILNYSSGVAKGSFNILTASHSPEDLLESVFMMAQEIGLVETVRMVSYNPAKALGLKGKGSIAKGSCADLIVVEYDGGLPMNMMTICSGKVVSELSYRSGQTGRGRR